MMIRQRRRGSYSHSKSKRQSSSSLTWVWILTGILIGVVGVVGIYSFFDQTSLKQYRVKANSQSNPPKALAEKSKKEKEVAQRFEFYTLLPGMEIQLPDKKQASNNSASHHSKANQTSSKVAQPSSQTQPQSKSNVALTQKSSSQSFPSSASVSDSIPKQKANCSDGASATASSSPSTVANSTLFIVQAGIFQGLTQADELKARLALQGFNTRIQKVQTQEGDTWFRVTLGPFTSEALALNQKKRLAQQKIQGILILQRSNT
jgi:cell division protein FtsN